MDYWPIVGYGLRIDFEFISKYMDMKELAMCMIMAPMRPTLVADLDDCTHIGDIYDILNEHDIFTGDIVEYISKFSTFIQYECTEEVYNGDETNHYLMFPYTAPWSTDPMMSKEKVEDEIIGLLSKYLLDTTNTYDIRKLMKEHRNVGGLS